MTGLEYNLSTYFMLPLLKLKSSMFGENNLINTYITKTQQVVVEVKDKEVVTWKYWEHQNYAVDFDLDGKTTIIFNVPSVYTNDFNNFVEGKYSEFSTIAKKLIKSDSGLSYMKPIGEEYFVEKDGYKVKMRDKTTHKYLLALDKDASLKKHLEETLDIKIKEDAELLDKPKETEFIKL
jgi:hypothetical protein